MNFDVFTVTAQWASDNSLTCWTAEETDSTNRFAKDDPDSRRRPSAAESKRRATEPTLYLARKQTSGRGRGSNSWSTTDGALLASWSFGLESVPQPVFAPLAGLALFEAISATFPHLSFSLKAPNDLYLDERKVAGILIETVSTGSEVVSVVGIGLNVFSAPTDVPTSTALFDHAGLALNEASWRAFLSRLRDQLCRAAEDGLKSEMSPQVTSKIKEALNLHPLLKEPILSVDSQGQLQTASRTWYWHEL